MIDGFEYITSGLTDKMKKKVVPILVDYLVERSGCRKATTNRRIRLYLATKGYDLNPASVRAMINYIRRNELVPCLVASQSGYFIADTRESIDRYISSLAGREMAIRSVREAMEKQAEAMV